ncbi:hypothetical protein EYF80_043936 [Liparis tanakae]|uniref:Uncharacterized protein n=1 Tax=Liparis tanakae TaxID=230148 RepID=A0A4Z2FX81_9TELE|nr:hypothetical protein EYF80_043936 [Liparis tanakae]
MKLRQRHSCGAAFEIPASTDVKNRTQNKPRRLATTTGWRAPAPADSNTFRFEFVPVEPAIGTHDRDIFPLENSAIAFVE